VGGCEKPKGNVRRWIRVICDCATTEKLARGWNKWKTDVYVI
jgi:hypothetical protein